VANVGDDGDDPNDDEQPMSPVRGRGVATTRGDENSDDEQTTLPVCGREAGPQVVAAALEAVVEDEEPLPDHLLLTLQDQQIN